MFVDKPFFSAVLHVKQLKFLVQGKVVVEVLGWSLHHRTSATGRIRQPDCMQTLISADKKRGKLKEKLAVVDRHLADYW